MIHEVYGYVGTERPSSPVRWLPYPYLAAIAWKDSTIGQRVLERP